MMKKLSRMILVVLLGIVCLAGCAGEEKKEAIMDQESGSAVTGERVEEEENPESSEAAAGEQEEASVPEEEAQDIYLDQYYKEILDQYYTALSEEWDEGKYYENGLCAMMAFYYDDAPLDNLGYALIDLDFDGEKELLLGAMLKEEKYPVLMELYTVSDGEAVHLLTSDYRNTYYLEWLEEGAYEIANEGSASAAMFGYHYYTLIDGKLEVTQAVIHDLSADEDNPWFLAWDDDWDTSNDEQDVDGMAQAIVDSHEARYMQPEYVPFRSLK